MTDLARQYHDIAESTPTAPTLSFGMSPCKAVASLFADGKSPKDIATVLSLDEDKVRAILRMPETQEVLAQLVIQQGDNVVANILKASKLDTVLALIRLRDNGSSDTVRLAACKELLDRSEGRAISKDPKAIDLPSNYSTDPQVRMKQLQDEILQIQKRERTSPTN